MNTLLTNKAFWLSTLDRAIRTFAQAVAAQIIGVTGGVLAGVVPHIPWLDILYLSGLTALLTVLNSISAPAGETRLYAQNYLESKSTPAAAAVEQVTGQ